MSMLETVENVTSSVLNRILGDDIYSQLKAEHRELEDLLAKAEDAPVSKRLAILQRIEKTLVPHARAEEKTLYSLMFERLKAFSDQGGEAKSLTTEAMNLTNEAYQEHRAVDMLMSDLKKTDVESEIWLAKLKVIKENLEHHIKEEENDLFEKAEELFSKEESQEILESYLKQKQEFIQTLPTQEQISERKPSMDASKLV